MDKETPLVEMLSGGDLRSVGKSNRVVKLVRTQASFDELFALLLHSNRIVVMRAADSVEKISGTNPDYLQSHKSEIMSLCETATDKELVWHLAQLVPRLRLTAKERKAVWKQLTDWALNKKASRIVRVNALQSLADLLNQDESFDSDFNRVVQQVSKENIPSINARIRLLRSKKIIT